MALKNSVDEFQSKVEERELLESSKNQMQSQYHQLLKQIDSLRSSASRKFSELSKLAWNPSVFPDDAQDLYKKDDGLYEHGFDVRTLHRLFVPPISSVRASAGYHGKINARRATRKNNWREVTEGTHFARAERRLVDEFMESQGQLRLSCDDMNIIQVGRSAVSRFHQMKTFFPVDSGPDYAVHDFPNSEYGIKLGGFMVQGTRNCTWQNQNSRARGTEDIDIRSC